MPQLKAQASEPRQEVNVGLASSARIFAVDPGQKSGKNVVLFPDDHTEQIDLKEFVLTLQPGDVVATESTMHLYRPQDRKEILEEVHKRGAEMWAMRSTQTSRARKALTGSSKKEDDETDARSIAFYFKNKRHLFYKLRVNPERLGTINEPNTPRFDLNYRLVRLRREGYPGFKDLHDATIHILAEIAFNYNLNRRQFDKFTGFHGCGYPNIARSNRNKHGAGKKPELRNQKMKEYRQKARQLFSKLKAQARIPRQEVSVGSTTSALKNTLEKL